MGDLKLGDFGWASSPGFYSGRGHKAIGSFWYAAPELYMQANTTPENAGVVGNENACEPRNRRVVHSRVDMWSVGVTAYLLLVGHNPFGAALHEEDPHKLVQEIKRLTTRGQYATSSSNRWMLLAQDAKEFLDDFLRTNPQDRPSATQALQHPYFRRVLGDNVVFRHPLNTEAPCQWNKLDGFQQLAWVAVARAVSEAEMCSEVVNSALRSSRSQSINDNAYLDTPGYVFNLAQRLASSPPGYWLSKLEAWNDVVRLAFCYLDVDQDGAIGPTDLLCHFEWQPQPMKEQMPLNLSINQWLFHWQPYSQNSKKTLDLSAFCYALLSSQQACLSQEDVHRNVLL